MPAARVRVRVGARVRARVRSGNACGQLLCDEGGDQRAALLDARAGEG